MAPGGVLDVVLDVFGGLDGSARKHLGEGDGLVTECPTGDADGLGDGLEIGGVVAGAGVKL